MKFKFFTLFLLMLILVPPIFAEVLVPKDATISKLQTASGVEATVSKIDGTLTLSKWNSLATITVGEIGRPSSFSNTLGTNILDYSGYTVKIYKTSIGVEYDIILKEIPKSNIFTLPITSTGLDFFYQPPLNEELTGSQYTGWTITATTAINEKGEIVNSRPENVVGSYAVYYSEKNNVYKTGKAFHIYRPYVSDAKGNTVWASLNFDGSNLIVTVNQKWLSNAAYPVVVDPSFGYDSQGGTEYSTSSANIVIGSAYTTPSTAIGITLTGMAAYAKKYSGATNIKLGLWANTDDGALITNALTGGVALGDALAWKSATFATKPVVPISTTYMVSVLVSNGIKIQYDTGGTSHRDSANSYAIPENFDWDFTNDYKYSIYVNYTSTYPDSAAITDRTNSTNCYGMYDYYTFTVNAVDTSGNTNIRKVYLQGTQGAVVRFEVRGTALDTVPVWAIQTGATIIDLDDASCTWNSTTGVATFKIRFEWDFTSEDNLELYGYVESINGANSGYVLKQTNYYNIITVLFATIAADDASLYLGQEAHVQGNVTYPLTTAGAASSLVAPPDAQFTRVRVLNEDDYVYGTDTTIVDGAYSIVFIPPYTIQVNTFHLWLDLVPDYTDGEPLNNPTVNISVLSSVSVIPSIFSAYGILNFFTTIDAMLTSISAFFVDSITLIVDSTTLLFRFVIGAGTFFLDWGNRVATIVLLIISTVLGILDGTGSVTSGLGNIWTFFSVGDWIDFIPICIVISWLLSLDSRQKQTGQSYVLIALNDIQIGYGLLSIITSVAWNTFNFVIDIVMRFMDALL